MELIKALEQLSLEVRNKNESLSLLEKLEPVNRWSSSSGVAGRERNHDTSYSKDSSVSHQFLDFNNSIETLFTQISELENFETESRHHYDAASLQRKRFAYPSPMDQSNSMETSQEEDSDCSSQQSSGNTGTSRLDCGGRPTTITSIRASRVNPLVRDLMKRDLGAITETVRKISRILALGHEIETIYTSQLNETSIDHKQMLPKQQFNPIYTQSLCDEFLGLCAGEPHIKAMPTILKYNDYCQKLLLHLNDLTRLKEINNSQCSSASLQTVFARSSGIETAIYRTEQDRYCQLQDPIYDYSIDDDDDEDDDDDLEITLLNSESNTAIWKDNKLYMDNQSNKF